MAIAFHSNAEKVRFFKNVVSVVFVRLKCVNLVILLLVCFLKFILISLFKACLDIMYCLRKFKSDS